MNQLARVGTGLCLAITCFGCVPWTLGQTAETLAPGSVSAGVGAAVLSPPQRITDALPVPQIWVRTGLRDGLDAGLTYVAPGTAQLDLKQRLHTGPQTVWAVRAGGGIHAMYDVLDLADRASMLHPFVSACLLRSSRTVPDTHANYAAVRAFMPFHTGHDFAAALWLTVSTGRAWHTNRWQFGPEIGLAATVSQPTAPFLLAAFSVRRRPF